MKSWSTGSQQTRVRWKWINRRYKNSAVKGLINRFKEFNRVKKKKPITTDSEIVGNPSTEVVDNPISIPKLKCKATYSDVPDGENQTSFERHNCQINFRIEENKAQPSSAARPHFTIVCNETD